MAAKQACVTLNTGAKMPLMAFGTLMENLEPDHARVVGIIENAIDVGYRHMDCARIYHTEEMVGEAIQNKIKSGAITREDVFVTTKLWRNAYSRESVVPALKESLERLGLPYVDLFLIHWPTAFKTGENIFPKDGNDKFIYADIDYLDTWKGMEECADLGLAKAIGVSNFNSKQIQRILDNCKIPPANNQIESHPFLANDKIIKFCKDKDISVCAYAPLAGFNPSFREKQGWPTVFTDETIAKIATKHKRTPAQVALRFQLDRSVAVAPKSAKRERMEDNFKALEFTLDAEDMAALAKLDQNFRLNAEFPDHPHYPFHEEF